MKKTLLAMAVLSSLAACHNTSSDVAPPAYQQQAAQPQQYQQAQQPQTVVVQQPAQQSSGMGDMLTGAAIGAMATHMLSGGSRQAAPAPVETTRVIERRTVVNNYIDRTPKAATPVPTPAAPVAQAPAPTPAKPASSNYAVATTRSPSNYSAMTSRSSSSYSSTASRSSSSGRR